MARALRVGTRGSELALAQTRGIVASLQRTNPGVDVAIEVIQTKGDRVTDVPLSQVGDRGLFIKELENALMDERIDFAVHSMKDLPSLLPPGLVVASVTERLDPRDVLISRKARTLQELPRNATLATGSLRRRSQALARRPDLRVLELRGNITTRLRKFEESDWDSMILAGAGLARLGLTEHATTPIPTEEMLPAVGQGALGLEARQDDVEVLRCLQSLGNEPTSAEVEAERALLRRLEGGCQVPIGAHGSVVGDELELTAYVGTIDGRRHLRRKTSGAKAEARRLGESLADAMLRDGAKDILEETRAAAEGTSQLDGR